VAVQFLASGNGRKHSSLNWTNIPAANKTATGPLSFGASVAVTGAGLARFPKAGLWRPATARGEYKCRKSNGNPKGDMCPYQGKFFLWLFR
jgi:hypothetical protein